MTLIDEQMRRDEARRAAQEALLVSGAVPTPLLPYIITASDTEPTPVAGRINLWIDTSAL